MNADTVVNGLLLGGLYALVALGLSIVFGVLRLINLAHGELLVAGAYLAYLAGEHLGLGPFAALPLVVAVTAALAYLLQRFLLTGLLVRSADGALVATFGLSLLAQGAFAQGFDSTPKALSSSLSTSGLTLAGVHTRTAYLVAFAAAAVLCAAAHLLLNRTRLGTTVRAAAADPTTSGLMGIDIRQVYAVTFALGAAVTAVGGVLLGVTYSFTPTTGTSYLLIGIAVVVLGGVGSVAGTFAGALLLGLVQSLAAAQFGGGYRDLSVYLLFFVVLALRPQGLLARRAAS
ncbi:branched-chain amino acid ABC transporter permease [Actinacidiphila sp. DG2A-62]|uniref:branched-chain amino acid ABC transporter permease n=1 Tax=Actinacidiphila sp. DG2A-62 TaxID=3108821 RepID=UPI002DBD19EA|nr:branched-chain amino acid ABC transporter permease [Actinacidiphila sp. DG2A-62]MEC3993759.1 branched-chain amino acid ABC transporter permease [Actinacidiphila sp. DG2A-62]